MHSFQMSLPYYFLGYFSTKNMYLNTYKRFRKFTFFAKNKGVCFLLFWSMGIFGTQPFKGGAKHKRFISTLKIKCQTFEFPWKMRLSPQLKLNEIMKSLSQIFLENRSKYKKKVDGCKGFGHLATMVKLLLQLALKCDHIPTKFTGKCVVQFRHDVFRTPVCFKFRDRFVKRK